MEYRDPFNTLNLFSAIILASLLALTVAGCTRSDVSDTSQEKQAPLAAPSVTSQKTELRIGMGAMVTPEQGYLYYSRLKEYLEKELQIPVRLVDRNNYAKINELLAADAVDIAFVCSGPYVEGHDQFGLELLATPLVKGKPLYHSYIIVPKNSPAKTFDDLRGRSFAFTDPLSNSGKIVPSFMLAERKETPESFFGKVSYTYGHDKSIMAVAEKFVDGAAVDSLIWEYLDRTQPELTRRTKVIDVSAPYGIPPLVVRKNLSAEIKGKILKTLIAMHESLEGRVILEGMMIDRFVPGDDANYDSIRVMKRWIASQKTARNS